MNKGFTLIELIVVVIVLGVLVAFAVPQYARSKEKALDNEAKGYLVLIQAAENLYKIENGSFYESSDHEELNDKLSVSLPLEPTPPQKLKWIYKTNVSTTATPATVCVDALRNGDNKRSWHMMDTDSTPSAGGC